MQSFTSIKNKDLLLLTRKALGKINCRLVFKIISDRKYVSKTKIWLFMNSCLNEETSTSAKSLNKQKKLSVNVIQINIKVSYQHSELVLIF